ncbi:uncharacterized protein MONOS_17442 [Monocercomonoides exilis]|uniref:uncharacterized protein n=1 Tax=Monocercomonoides exilis TaxID=2049356 RepID=UPI0035597F01|nr:hypothetical protein MONOS_17442 [Monocercomonoides exilis]
MNLSELQDFYVSWNLKIDEIYLWKALASICVSLHMLLSLGITHHFLSKENIYISEGSSQIDEWWMHTLFSQPEQSYSPMQDHYADITALGQVFWEILNANNCKGKTIIANETHNFRELVNSMACYNYLF